MEKAVIIDAKVPNDYYDTLIDFSIEIKQVKEILQEIATSEIADIRKSYGLGRQCQKLDDIIENLVTFSTDIVELNENEEM